MAQQTSVEWFIKEILKHDKSFVEFYGAEIEQLKEKHKAEIEEAYNHRNITTLLGRLLTAEQYYNETYGK